jgi:hypothetical protein
MSKNKLLFIFFIGLMANIQRINAMEVEDAFNNIKTVKTSALPVEETNNSRQKTVKKLWSEFDSSLNRDFISDLKAIKSYYNTGYDFGDKELNYTSLVNWVIYTRSLGALEKLGFKEEGTTLKEELDRAKRRLELIDFYTDNKDYKYCLSGIWSIVSTFDKEERKKFLEALRKGEEVPYDESLVKFFESSK